MRLTQTGFLLLAALASLPALADEVRCESRDGRREECRIDGRNGVRLVQQLSSSDCREGSSWGYDSKRVWVEDGCRAVFSSVDARSRGNAYGRESQVRCESRDGRREECRIDGASGVRLVEQLSDADCREGRNWGYSRGKVWVEDGCRAVFAATGSGYGQSSGGNRWSSGGREERVRCESRDGRREECRLDGSNGVRLAQQLSETDCREGRNWGYDRKKVWVEDGCRAEFVAKGSGRADQGDDRHRPYEGPFRGRITDAAASACMRFKAGAEEIIDVSGPNLSWYEVILRAGDGNYRCTVTEGGRVEKYARINR